MTNDSSREDAPQSAGGIEWTEGNIPRSARFADTYYSRADGLAETRHVFLAGNDLATRFAATGSDGSFTIAETGFGTGLNFLAALELWQQIAPAGARLDYLSFEQFPLSAVEIERALSRWPAIAGLAEPLLAQWQPDPDFFRWQQEGVSLAVFMGDANTRLPQLDLPADAWFLDGFAPARNPELWNGELMAEVFRHTKPGGTFATYTAAGWVRRNLEAAGFAVERIPGHAGKREMMRGLRPHLHPAP